MRQTPQGSTRNVLAVRVYQSALRNLEQYFIKIKKHTCELRQCSLAQITVQLSIRPVIYALN